MKLRTWNPLSYAPVHWTILTAFLASLGAQVSAIATWSEITRPLFVGGVLAQVGSLLAALYAHPPVASTTVDPDWQRRTPR